jgi:hypothetical protein
MRTNEILQKVKAFGMTNQMIVEDLSRIEAKYSVSLGHISGIEIKELVTDIYYPQFDAEVRKEAAVMARHYEMFYCLEKSIRSFVAETLESAFNIEDWWNHASISEEIKKEVKSRIQKEVDAGMTRRSLDELDYTTFGELGEIIKQNWDSFGGTLGSRKAVEKIMSNLNALRNPIAHCSPLAEDEILRLQLTMRDWFRLLS